ncbi:hypothetical protein [Nocardia sp. NPDC046763]|uniref:hypothetical protein n=1 Tax=Nocardia sp. NPDC046763 TaxID=3155256 RepID=UPI00340F6B31
MARHLLAPYHRTGVARPASQPLGTLTTRDRFRLFGITRPTIYRHLNKMTP